MSTVTATVSFDQASGTVKFSLDLQGATELDHELLAATISSGRSVSIVPAHKGEELFAEFIIKDTSIWPKAARALENRKRIANGQPTIEQEESQAVARKNAQEDAEKAASDEKAKADADAK